MGDRWPGLIRVDTSLVEPAPLPHLGTVTAADRVVAAVAFK